MIFLNLVSALISGLFVGPFVLLANQTGRLDERAKARDAFGHFNPAQGDIT